MWSDERTPSDRGRMWRRFAVLVAAAALLLPTQAFPLAPPAAAAVTCPAGTTSQGSGRCQAVFNGSSTWSVPNGVSLLDIVLVGGGGGGGGNQDPRSSLPGSGGGGGGGQVVHATNQPVTAGASATITVAAGGTGGPDGPGNGTSGGTSSFVTTGVDVSAAGGSPGGGGSWGQQYPSGSGYGGASGAGYAGGVPDLTVGGSPTTWSTHMGGGGGGSSAPGSKGTDVRAGDGGAGTVPSGGLFAGYTTAYAGGGGGGSASVGGYTTAPGQGAAGGGAGNGSTILPGNAAGANTGSGGGGTGSFTAGTGGAGGSGIVIVRFLAPGATKLSQTISFTSTPPTNAVVGGSTYAPTASASSGLPVDFTVDSSATAVCSIGEGAVSFTAVGTCRINANQAGNPNWNAATQVYQSFVVGKGSQMVTFTSTAPTSAQVGGSYTVSATGGGSGNPVVFSTGTTSVCTVSGSTVSLIGVGTCTIDADQAGNTNWNAAPEVQQSFGVAVVPLTQTIYFNTSPSGYPTVGGTYAAYSTADSELPVTLTIDSAASLVCSISGSPPSWAVSLIGVGTCTINANQAGGINKYGKTYYPADQLQQTFEVHPAGPWTCPAGTLSVGGGICERRFNASSAWTVPAGVTSVDVLVVGGGGGAGGGKSGNCAGGGASGGGGGGEVVQTTNRAVTPGTSVTVTVGGGGAGSAYQGPYATSGGTSSFVTTGVTLRAAGGLYGNEGCAGSSLAYNAGEGGASGRYGYVFGGNEGGQPYIQTTVIHDPERPIRTTYRTQAGGGGGGSSAAGANGGSSAGGAGGAGTVPSSGLLAAITTAFGGGGGGGATSGTPGAGAGGGGTGVGQSATPNTGGGGGGTGNSISGTGGAGGSGIVIVRFSNQSITFTSTTPSSAVVGGPAYTVTATATSGQAVSLAVDSSATSVCSLSGSISGSTVSFIGVGTCKIDATQAGGGNWGPAVPAQQSFAVGKGGQTIQFTSNVPGAATIGGSYTPTATGGGSGNPVVFSIDATASSVCSINAGVVTINGNGVCTINANQAGNANYDAAPQAQQSFGVGLMNITSTADELTADGNCSLREAIRAANTDTAVDGCPAGSGADIIYLPAGVYNLTIAGAGEDAALTGDLDITADLTVMGAGAATTIIDGGDLDRVFEVLSGKTATLSDLTVHNGTVSDQGGGIRNGGTLTLDGVTVRGNAVTNNSTYSYGGGIDNAGTLKVVDSTVADNTAGGYGSGAGIANETGATATITGSMITDNAAGGGSGGGLWNKGTATLRTSTVSGNTTTNGAGGGLYTDGSLTVADSTVSGNSVTSSSGGGIAASATSSVLLERSTVSDNHATGSSANGGGIYVAPSLSGTVAIVNSTLSGNTASGYGGGLATYTGWHTSLIGSTITGNTGGSAGYGHGVYQYQGAVSAKGTLIYGNGTGNADCATARLTSTGANFGSSSCFGGATDITAVDPLLGPLADNGGPTFTHELLAGSPAIDAASACDTATDQRGISRPQGSKCDIGSFEVVDTTHAPTTTTLVCSPDSIPLGQGTLCTATVQSSSASVPTGTVTFTGTANGSLPSPATCTLEAVDSDSASCSLTYIPSAVGSGAHTLGASYGGDATHAASADADGCAVQVAARANVPPTISAIGDQSTNEDTATAPIGFTIGDADSDIASLVLTGGSSNALLVPDGSISFGGSGVSRTVAITPAAGLSGIATITITVSDGTDDTSTSFQLTVTEVAKATQTITFTSTAPTNAVYGGSYSVTATGGGSGNPVIFSIASASSAVCSISGSTVRFIGVGTCRIDADQAGDDDYLPAAQVEQSVTVGPATPSVSIANIPSSAQYGGAFTPTFTYTGDGTTSVTSSTTSVCTVSAGVASYVGVGTCTLVAHATATTLYAAATGTAQDFSVGKAGLTITASSPTGVVYGDPVPTISPSYAGWVGTDGPSVLSSAPACTTTYKQGNAPGDYTTSCSGAAADNYTIAYTNGTLSVGRATPSISINNLPASGTHGGSFTPTVTYTGDGTTSVSSSTTSVCTVASGVVSFVGVGTCSLVAHATATTNYAAATGADQSFEIGQASQAITVTKHAPSSAAYKATFSVAATASSGLGVVITAYGACGVATGGVGTATIVMTDSTGTCAVVYDQPGNANFEAAPEVWESVTATTASQKITVTKSAPATAPYKGAFTVTATASSGLPISIAVSGVCTATSPKPGEAQVTMTSGTGTCTVVFDQPGNAYYQPATQVIQKVSATKASQMITVQTAPPATAVYKSSFTVGATASSNLNVKITTSGVCTGTGYGTAKVTMTSGTGTCTVFFDQAGNGNYAAATQVVRTVTAQRLAQAITFDQPTSPQTYGVTFQVSPVTDAPLAVGLAVDSGSVCSIAASPGGGWDVTMTSGTGSCVLTASQAGTTNYLPAADVIRTVVAQKAAASIAISNLPASGTYGAGFTPTFTYGGDGTTSVASSTTAVCTVDGSDVSYVGVGPCTLVAKATATTNYEAATGTSQSFNVVKATQTITFTTTAPANPVYGGSYTVTATGGGSGNPVTFNIASASSAICTISGSTVSFIGVGTCTIEANQVGNDNYLPAPQAEQSFGVGRAALTVTANDQTVQYSDPLPVLTVEYNGFVGSESPSVLDGSLGCATTAIVTAGKVLSPAGAYSITCTGQTSPDYDIRYVPGTLTVTREDTVVRLAQNNPHAVVVATKGKAPALTFVLRITEVSDTSYGDISKASPVTIALTPVGTGSNGTTCTVSDSGKIVQTQPATATSPGFVVVSCTVPAGTLGINVYEVAATVGGTYYQDSDRSVLTVYDPLAGGANGAGTITNPNTGNAADIAFSAGYLKNGRQVQGKFLYVSRDADGNVVHVLKGNVMNTMAIDGKTALVTGKATFDGVGNYTYVITAIDNGTTAVPNPTATPDQYGQKLTDGSGATVTTLTFDPVAIGTSGNIFVGNK